MWSNYDFDDAVDSKATIEERAAKTFKDRKMKNGDVLLIHPRNNDIAKAVGVLIDTIQKEGYKLVTVGELLERKNGGEAGKVYADGIAIY